MEQHAAKLLPAVDAKAWHCCRYDGFGPNLRKVLQDLRRDVLDITRAIEIVNKSNRMFQRMTINLRGHNYPRLGALGERTPPSELPAPVRRRY
jgi:hypothetical protein